MGKYLKIAKFTKPQGLKGELRAQTYCDSPYVLEDFEHLYLGEGEPKSPVKITLCEVRKGFVVLKADGVHSVEKAEQLTGQFLYINREDYPLPENTWFIGDLIGLQVVDADSGEVYGTVEEILQNAPKDVYVIKTPNGRRLMFPSIPEVLIDTDITVGRITIRPLEGLFDS